MNWGIKTGSSDIEAMVLVDGMIGEFDRDTVFLRHPCFYAMREIL